MTLTALAILVLSILCAGLGIAYFAQKICIAHLHDELRLADEEIRSMRAAGYMLYSDELML